VGDLGEKSVQKRLSSEGDKPKSQGVLSERQSDRTMAEIGGFRWGNTAQKCA